MMESINGVIISCSLNPNAPRAPNKLPGQTPPLHHRIRHFSSQFASAQFTPFASAPFLPSSASASASTSASSSIVAAASSNNSDINPSAPKSALLLEVQGVLIDIHRLGSRQAFNAAFRKLRLDCANWTQPIYADLLRRTSGDEEKMVRLYFNKIGWPTSLPTSEIEAFVKSVLQEKKNAVTNDDVLMTSGSSLLRPGVREFIEEADSEGIPVVVLTTYGEVSGEKVSRKSIVDNLGDELASKVKVLDQEEVDKSLYGQLISRNMLSTYSSEQISSQVSKAVLAEKQKIANEVAATLNVSVEIDTTSAESLQEVVVALRAGAELSEVPVKNCVLVAGSQVGLAGAKSVGMPCIVVRSSLTYRAEFPTAKATYDGFGGADLTVAKLRNLKLI